MAIVFYLKSFPKHLSAFTTDNQCDFFFDKSTPRLSLCQKRFLARNKIKDIENLYNIQQIHGKRVVCVKKKDFNNQKQIPKADALITNDLNVALAVRTADCIPLFLFDPKHKAIGLVHGGWKSVKKEIVKSTVKEMSKKYQTNPKDLRVAFGPSVRKCCFEVKEKFSRNFPEEYFKKDNKYYVDLIAVAKKQLSCLGVQERNIFDSNICTCCDKKFFSYRRGDVASGRMVSVFMLT